ncbi:D-tyrosyl-tRNA(Tyr) deacylase, partial [Candidatus Fermentibacterales bacterium]|nr:D-tyrosyl-tRNA(Tyr) deacylase [Candidatus Fermentibacterales bacterium]
MKALLQRVSRASVSTGGQVVDSIGRGLLVLAGFRAQDTRADLEWMASKILNLRVFPDDAGEMNVCLGDVRGELLVVSQFTLHADTRKGRRPSFVRAAPPEQAETLFALFVEMLRSSGTRTGSGVFGAMMDVELVNDGPVT